jgi:hypothetical protein
MLVSSVRCESRAFEPDSLLTHDPQRPIGCEYNLLTAILALSINLEEIVGMGDTIWLAAFGARQSLDH